MLTVLFDDRIGAEEKIGKLESYGLKLTREAGEEVKDMCNYADAIEMKGIRRGLKRGLKQGRKEGKEEGIKEGRAEGRACMQS